MNPYDFVCIDWTQPPVREKPIWHYQLVGTGQQTLYSGQIELAIHTETPLFIIDPHTKNVPAKSLCNKQGEYILPGSSLKGMLRSVVETVCRGCLTLFDGNYEPIKKNGRVVDYDAPYKQLVPREFFRCTNNNELCLSCRIFGMMRPKPGDGNSDRDAGAGKNLFLGKVNIGDARAQKDSPLYREMHTKDLMGAHPHHDDFYLDRTKTTIAGRKYYFHHATLPVPSNRATSYNRYIRPLDMGTTFHARLDFVSLTADECAALLFALTLEEHMRHKIGYAKPLGLGSVHLLPQRMTLIDYANRYSQAETRGRTTYDAEAIKQFRDSLLVPLSKTQLVTTSLQDLRRIWQWPAANVVYNYPDYGWFDANRGTRIAQTP